MLIKSGKLYPSEHWQMFANNKEEVKMEHYICYQDERDAALLAINLYLKEN